MKIAIDDKCLEEFKQLKFDKKFRYIIYKVEKETIVIMSSDRSSKMLENVKPHGNNF